MLRHLPKLVLIYTLLNALGSRICRLTTRVGTASIIEARVTLPDEK